MTDFVGKLIGRSNPGKRRAWLLGSAALLACIVLYFTFELGRYDAGFRVADSIRGALSAGARIRDLEGEIQLQREQLAAADVARRVDREGYKEVERSLGDMQGQINRLTQDLSFYRGLVQPDSLVHVKVQQMQIIPEGAAGQYRLKFVLVQSGKPDNTVAGAVNLLVDGSLRGKPTSVNFTQVSPRQRSSLTYSFRYFQDYDEPVQLPLGFEPTRIGVEIHSNKDFGHGFRQAFVWKAQGMSMETEAGGDPAADHSAAGSAAIATPRIDEGAKVQTATE
jgi:hypothetical protein